MSAPVQSAGAIVFELPVGPIVGDFIDVVQIFPNGQGQSLQVLSSASTRNRNGGSKDNSCSMANFGDGESIPCIESPRVAEPHADGDQWHLQ